MCSVIEGTGVFAAGSNSFVLAGNCGESGRSFPSSIIWESASTVLPGNSFLGRVKRSPLRTIPSPTRNVIMPGPTHGVTSGLSAAMMIVTIIQPRPTVAVITPARIRRKRFSSGDSQNFSKCGKTSSATCSRSLPESSSRILSAKALLICSRAETAEAVMASGRSRVLRTRRRSVPHARQYWLSCLSSEPQDGQYIRSDYTAGGRGSSYKSLDHESKVQSTKFYASTFTPFQNAT